jgi:hypothetical protein
MPTKQCIERRAARTAETASKTDETDLSWHASYLFPSSLVFHTVAAALDQLGNARGR